MQQNENVQTLIDKAVKIVGSKANLARAMGVPSQKVNSWHSGFCACVPEDRARIAGFAREDAVQELIRATLEKTEGTLRGDQLRQVLGKWSRQIGEGLHGAALAAISLIYGLNQFDLPQCIKSEIKSARYTFC